MLPNLLIIDQSIIESIYVCRIKNSVWKWYSIAFISVIFIKIIKTRNVECIQFHIYIFIKVFTFLLGRHN